MGDAVDKTGDAGRGSQREREVGAGTSSVRERAGRQKG